MRPAQELQIIQTDSSLTVDRSDGHPLTLFFDGRVVSVSDSLYGRGVELSGRWDGRKFVVRREATLMDEAVQVASYEFDEKHLRLKVHVTPPHTNDFQPPAMTWVYDFLGR